MGSGKSTIGKMLAKKLGIAFIDLDEYIEASEDMGIPEIFKTKGEVYFRKKEYEYLGEVLNDQKDFVLSTGGGTPCYGENMNVINNATSNVFYLKVTIAALIERLALEKAERPLIANIPDRELPDFIGKHLFERSFFYAKANHTINSNGKEVGNLVTEIQDLLV
jgi:shikimate kinase